jgi:hypothetical protein
MMRLTKIYLRSHQVHGFGVFPPHTAPPLKLVPIIQVGINDTVVQAGCDSLTFPLVVSWVFIMAILWRRRRRRRAVASMPVVPARALGRRA